MSAGEEGRTPLHDAFDTAFALVAEHHCTACALKAATGIEDAMLTCDDVAGIVAEWCKVQKPSRRVTEAVEVAVYMGVLAGRALARAEERA